MNTSDMTIRFPLQITFRKMKPLPEAEQWVRLEAGKLQAFYKRIMGCRVAVERPPQRRLGSSYHLRVDLTVPGGELVVRHEPNLKTRTRQSGQPEIRKQSEARIQHKDLHQAIRDAFKATGRRLQDYARRQRGDTKRLETLPSAKVDQIFAQKGYGFLLTPEGRVIYFHRNSVLNRAFGLLKVGTAVTFVEEPGEHGPQASTVRVPPRLARRQAARSPAA